ncbi:protein-L-isoaspartate O-methyltransferase family protein [Hydrogenophaga sp. PBL-H3]|uniref:protein-L-isoaspartate O-methyltransferase family protein n=1 Tax=Hydrogenophaga sp. PBL-H3 TaxID=434010 RepID=UPI00131F8EEA|nr:protein-L-isoaspartate O-methyltransferase [Hydrogenophaga sp. PBL-H3]QHE77282.1 protein-L-isoaspartate O-methyltransferase [Hydrogenophaga sp. PBL-H3]QHE81706.1 protein-L-isoaspartate O-methyltransferase [Hydrogenophaga sp. PBL-H3]
MTTSTVPTIHTGFDHARFNMIEQQIRPWEVLAPQVLALLARMHREAFVPAAHRALAFADMELPLTHPAVEGQCMLAPKVEARLLQDLDLKPTDKVLEIGSGSGYMAALLANLAQRVVSIEIDAALASTARDNLRNAGIGNVDIKHADAAAQGFAACGVNGPFDAILLSGSVAEIPPALLALLAPGGRLAAIVGFEPMMRATIVTRVGDASFQTAQPWDTVAPRLLNFPEPSRFRF